MNRFSDLLIALTNYRDDVDSLVNDFLTQDANDRRIYNNDEYSRRHAANVAEYGDQLSKRRDQVVARSNSILEKCQNELSVWTTKPIDSELASTLSAIRQSGLKLSKAEISALYDQAAGNYLAGRLVDQIAHESGLLSPSRQKPIDNYISLLKSAIGSIDVFTSAYCGKMARGRELLSNDVSFAMIAAATTAAPLKSDSSLAACALVWPSDAMGGRKRHLTIDDKKFMDRLYSGYETHDERVHRTKELLSQTPELRETLRLDPQIATYIKDLESNGEN